MAEKLEIGQVIQVRELNGFKFLKVDSVPDRYHFTFKTRKSDRGRWSVKVSEWTRRRLLKERVGRGIRGEDRDY